MPRPSGAERDAYIKAEMLALPTNGPFREIEELQNVMGMTPEIYAVASPYLTTHGSAQVNLNTAPVPVLRSLPGMTDATLTRILQLRSQGRRIESVNEIFPSAQNGRRLPGQLAGRAVIDQIGARAGVNTAQLELTITARLGPQAPTAKLIAVIANQNRQAVVQYKQW
jgi:type II secretory pathway component PulK